MEEKLHLTPREGICEPLHPLHWISGNLWSRTLSELHYESLMQRALFLHLCFAEWKEHYSLVVVLARPRIILRFRTRITHQVSMQISALPDRRQHQPLLLKRQP